VRALAGDGTSLAFPDGTFDAVVLGLVLCSVPSVESVVAEAFRVLRRGGRLRALEHVRSEAPIAGLLMDATNPLWLRLNRQGSNWNRQPLPKIEAAGFQIDDVRASKRFDTLHPAFPIPVRVAQCCSTTPCRMGALPSRDDPDVHRASYQHCAAADSSGQRHYDSRCRRDRAT